MSVDGLLGRKLGMTRIFTEEGSWVDVTLLRVGPCTVVQRKTEDKDGYEAVQLGFEPAKAKRLTKPVAGHFDRAGVDPMRQLAEFTLVNGTELNPGDEVKADIFKAGDRVDVSGRSKGKGFQGVIKRHGFGGGPGGHGSHHHREPGSIGQSADPSRVFKGKKLPGRMGNKKRTTRNLEVVDVKPEENLVAVRGCVPGANGSLITVRTSKKGAKK